MTGCTPCPPGFRRLLSCANGNAVPICETCISGETYSSKPNDYTRCQPCTTRCIIRDQVITEPCTTKRNAICQCKEGYYLRSPGELACEKHMSCPLGQGVKVKGTPTSDTVCEVCPTGQYSSIDSAIDTCHPHTTCSNLGGIKTHGDRTSDNICVDSMLAQSGMSTSMVLIIILSVIGALAIIGTILYFLYKYLRNTNRWDSVRAAILHPHRHRKDATKNNLGGAELNSRQTINGGSLDVVISSANIKLSDTVSDIVKLNTSHPSQTKLSSTHKDVRGLLLSDSVDDNFTLLPSAPVEEGPVINEQELRYLSSQIAPDDIMLSRLEGALTEAERSSLLANSGASTPQQITYEHLRFWVQKNPTVNLNLALSDAISQLNSEANTPPPPTPV